jgi:uncharacterized protein (DUF58 family)
MTRPTHSGYLFLAVLMALYLASITSQSGLLLLLIGILTACFFINFSQARQAVRHVKIIPPAATHLSEGERLSQPWKITNHGKHTAGLLEALTKAGPLFRVASLAPSESAHPVPSLVFQRRGVYPCGEVRVATSFPFGLVRAERAQDLAGEMVVYPALYPAPSPPAAGYDLMVGGKHRGTRRTTSGTHFAGVRPLQPGDPFKQIHWKSSSKGLGLMVKTYDEELSGRVAVLIDPGQSGDEKMLDDCLRAAGSLLFAALDEGHHVEWTVLGDDEAHLVPPFDDGHEILDGLARVQLQRNSLTEAALNQAIAKVSQKSAVCLVLTGLSPVAENFVRELRSRNRIVSIYLPEADATTEMPAFRYGERHIAEAQ